MSSGDSTFGQQSNANCKTGIPDEKDLSRVLRQPEEPPGSILPELQNDDIVNCSYYGVKFHNIPNMIKLTYTGILAQSGSADIYAVIGYGDNSEWEDTSSSLMHKIREKTFELLTIRKREGNVNIAFKDAAGNWDNNSGKNYLFYENSGKGSH